MIVGFDPSTERRSAWAILDCGGEHGVRKYVAKGESTLEEIAAMLLKLKTDGTYDDVMVARHESGLVVGVECPRPQLNVHVLPHRIAVLGPLKAHQETLWQARAKAGSLIGTSYVAGAIAWMARGLGARVVELTPDQWRGALETSRKTKGTDQNALVKEAIQTLITGWPKVSNEHVRDAAGCGLAAYWQVRAERRSGT